MSCFLACISPCFEAESRRFFSSCDMTFKLDVFTPHISTLLNFISIASP